MAKVYTPQTWTDEVLAGPERYNILTDGGTPIESTVQIELDTAVSVAGSAVNSARMTHIEDGIDDVDTRLENLIAGTGDTLPAGAIASNAIITAKILDGNVTLAKLANIATASVFYRKTAGSGAPEVQTLATLKTDLGLSGNNSGDETQTTIGELIDGATSKTTPVDADHFGLMDSAAANVLKKLSWANLKTGMITAWGALINGLTQKATPADNDAFALMDSAATNATKKTLWSDIKSTLKTYFDTLYPLLAASNTWNTANADVDQIFNGDNRETLRVDASRDTVNISRLNIVAGSTLTIATGVVTATHSRHILDTQGGAATDDLDTIDGGADGDILILGTVSAARVVTVKDNTGNIELNGDFVMDSPRDTLMLVYRSSLAKWCELCRSSNA